MATHKWDPCCPFPTDLVTPVPVDPEGRDGPTKGQAAGARWRRTSTGMYVPTDTDSSRPEQRILEAAVRLPPGSAVTGWAACRWQGGNFLDGLGRDGKTRFPVPVLIGPRAQVRSLGDLQVSYERVREWEIWPRNGVRVTRPEKAVHDEMRRQPDPRERLVVLEMALAAGLTTRRRVTAYAAAHRSDRRSKRVAEVVGRASEHSRSPQETRFRWIAEEDAGLPPLLVNCPIHSREGRLLGIADLLDLDAGLVLEFDGADHRTARRHTADLAKDQAFGSRGLEVVRVSGLDLLDTDLVVTRVLQARRRAAFQTLAEREWVPRPRPDTLDGELERQEQENMMQEWFHELDQAWWEEQAG